MSAKRSSIYSFEGTAKRSKDTQIESVVYFHNTLKKCGIELKSQQQSVASQDTVTIIAKLNKILMEVEGRQTDYLYNIFFDGFKCECDDTETLEHYVLPTIIHINTNDCESLLKILLNVTLLQGKLIEYIFHKVPVLLRQPKFYHLAKNILKVFSSVDIIENNEILSEKLIVLLKAPLDVPVKQDILLAIPDIIQEHKHDQIASELTTILPDNELLIPSILDCLTYLCLSDSQFEDVHMKIMEAMKMANKAYYPEFVKFLLTPGRLTDNMYMNIIISLRERLQWSIFTDFDKVSSQKSTAKAIRNSVISSKPLAKVLLTVISNCEVYTDHKSIDIIFFLILYSTSDEMQKEVEKKMKMQIKLQILKKDLLEETFKTFKPILDDYLSDLIFLSNALLKTSIEPVVQTFASHMYMVMFSELKDGCKIIAALVQLIQNYTQTVLIALNILNHMASKNWSSLNSHSGQILALLEDMDDVNLTELKAIMNLVCGLAYSYQNSMIRDKVHISIIKQLGSSIPSMKFRGILAGIYAVKYVMKDDKEPFYAKQTIQHISLSTKHFPEMTMFFYDELSKIIEESSNMDEGFREWLLKELSKKWENFLVDSNYNKGSGTIRLTQLPLNESFSDEMQRVVNIAGLTLEHNKDKNIMLLSPLIRLVGILHFKKKGGNLSSIYEILEYLIAMPASDISIDDLDDSKVTKILDCHIHCVNFIRELLNVFVAQENVNFKSIFIRIHQLREQESYITNILLKKTITYKPPIYHSHIVNSGYLKEKVERKIVKSQHGVKNRGDKFDQNVPVLTGNTKKQQTNMIATSINVNMTNIQLRPLNLTLMVLLKHDLKSFSAHKTELSFEILSYLLSQINGCLEKILLPRIKTKTRFNNFDVEMYSPLEAEKQAKIVRGILLKVMDHFNVIIIFLDYHFKHDFQHAFESENAVKIMESCLCLELIYNFLSIYFRWFEFKVSQRLLFEKSLKTIANVMDDEQFSMEYLLKTVTKIFQKQEKYCITQSSAVSLIQLMCALKEHSTESTETSVVKEMAQFFLAKEWNTPKDEAEKGIICNQGIDILTKMYFVNNELNDLKTIAESLKNDVGKLSDNASVLTTFKSINKTNFSILFRNLGFALYDKVKALLKASLTNEKLVEMWSTVAAILKLMGEMVTTLNNKLMFSFYSKIFNAILKFFVTKGFSVLKIQFTQRRELIKDVLKDFETSAECLKSTSASNHSKLMKQIPSLGANLTCFTYKTKELIGHPVEQNSRKNTPQRNSTRNIVQQKFRKKITYAPDETDEDCDDDLPDDLELSDDNDVLNEDDYSLRSKAL